MKVYALALALCAAFTAPSGAQERVLDDFESLEPWSTTPSDGVRMTIASDSGYRGGAMRMDMDFQGGGGYAVVRRDLPIDYPENFQITFRVRGTVPPNNLEFKLIDESGQNVWWVNRRDFHFGDEWELVTIRARHVEFAWGPIQNRELTATAALEFAITAGDGGEGSVWIDELTFEPLEPVLPYTGTPRLSASSAARGTSAGLALDGDATTAWRSAGAGDEAVEVDFGQLRELGGVVLHWEPESHAADYAVLHSADGTHWDTAHVVRDGWGERSYVQMPETEARYLRLLLRRGAGQAYGLREIDVRPLAFGESLNALYLAAAEHSPRGSWPEAFTDSVQSYWTVIGAPAAEREAMMNEEGAVEVGKGRFSLAPFLLEGGRLMTWTDVQRTPSLMDDDLPIPSLGWQTDSLNLTTTAVVAGEGDDGVLYLRYRVVNLAGVERSVTLFPALRALQVNPPWQFLNTTGGAAHVRSLEYEDRGALRVNGGRDSTLGDLVVAVTRPHGFGATHFDGGEIVAHLRDGSGGTGADENTGAGGSSGDDGRLPGALRVTDALGRASGAFEYRLQLPPGDSADVVLAVPFGDAPEPPGMLAADSAASIVARALHETREEWRELLDRVQLQLPAEAADIAATVRSTLAYILVNQDGPRIQPGSRSYERSWIRDGALTSYALLRLGLTEPVRAFVEWYAPYQYENGKVPCCVDHRGADPVPEHDSHGELVFAVAEYVRITHDSAFARRMWPHVEGAIAYMDSLRGARMTPEYDTDSLRAYWGLLPESISHEGYSERPVHSFWDDFLGVRGYRDAAWLAEVVGEREQAIRIAASRDSFTEHVIRSLHLTMAMHGIDYLPGSVELGDFDATSTTIGVTPGGLQELLPAAALRRTFELYMEHSRARAEGTLEWDAYTPYEWRTVGTLVRLGMVDEAHEMIDFLMADRRPAEWNHWAEVVWRDPADPRFIGDMPHTWVGSDFIRSVLDLFAYEEESDSSLVVTAGIPERWLEGGEELAIRGLRTWYGPLDVVVRRDDSGATHVAVAGLNVVPPGGIVIQRPDGRRLVVHELGEHVIPDPE